MDGEQETGRALFSRHLLEIEKAIRRVASRKGLSTEQRQELYSLTMLRVIQNDFSVLCAYQGRSRWSTYLTVVVQRVLLDYRNRELGKWRPCSMARRLGKTAITLDRQINRDGLSCDEAVENLLAQGSQETQEALQQLAGQIPKRNPRRFIPLDRLPEPLLAQDTVPWEQGSIMRRLSKVLADNIRTLSEQDRRLLWLRFGRAWTVRRIAGSLGMEPRPLYRQFEDVLHRLRKRLESDGFRWRDISQAYEPPAFELIMELSDDPSGHPS